MKPADRLRILAALDGLQDEITVIREVVAADDQRAIAARYSGPGSTREKVHRIAAQLRAVGEQDVVSSIARRLGISKRHARRLLNEPPPATQGPIFFA
jgi:hypothetical protein